MLINYAHKKVIQLLSINIYLIINSKHVKLSAKDNE